MDMVFSVDRFVQPGETYFSNDVSYYPGGKGGNQAVAASKLGADVSMIGKVGSDSFGEQLIAELEKENVNTSHVLMEKEVKTGTAMITVNKDSENQILLFRGANFTITEGDIQRAEKLIRDADIVLLQLEIPLPVIQYAIELAKQYGKVIVLDPSPVSEENIPIEVIRNVDILLPNKLEAEILSNQSIYDQNTAKSAASKLLSFGINTVIIKLGDQGALLAQNNEFDFIKAQAVNVKDTTAAGDAFAGALVAFLQHTVSLQNSVEIANIAGAKTTERKGAIPSLPELEELQISPRLLSN